MPKQLRRALFLGLFAHSLASERVTTWLWNAGTQPARKKQTHHTPNRAFVPLFFVLHFHQLTAFSLTASRAASCTRHCLRRYASARQDHE